VVVSVLSYELTDFGWDIIFVLFVNHSIGFLFGLDYPRSMMRVNNDSPFMFLRHAMKWRASCWNAFSFQ
jgi:hypothetical protein